MIHLPRFYINCGIYDCTNGNGYGDGFLTVGFSVTNGIGCGYGSSNGDGFGRGYSNGNCGNGRSKVFRHAVFVSEDDEE